MGKWQPAVGIFPHYTNAQNTCSTKFKEMNTLYSKSLVY